MKGFEHVRPLQNSKNAMGTMMMMRLTALRNLLCRGRAHCLLQQTCVGSGSCAQLFHAFEGAGSWVLSRGQPGGNWRRRRRGRCDAGGACDCRSWQCRSPAQRGTSGDDGGGLSCGMRGRMSCDRPLRSRAVAGVSHRVRVGPGSVLASRAPSPPAATGPAGAGRGGILGGLGPDKGLRGDKEG